MLVLLLGGGLQGLSFGESLMSKGVVVDVISDELQIRKSRFFGNVYAVDPLSLESLFGILERKRYDVVVPMGDTTVSFLSKNKGLLEDRFGVRCACPTEELLSVVEDKSRFMEFCEACGIPHPITVNLKDKTFEDFSESVVFPVLIKPNFSVGARGITRVDSLQELQEKLPKIIEGFGPCTLQEFVDNQEYYYNVMLYRDKNGDILAHTILKIVRMYPITAGSSSCCITIENEDLLQICKNCLDKLGWVGMADFDVLQRLDNSEYKVIEINPRVPASLRAAFVSGVNFPEIIVQDVMQMDIPNYEYVPGKILRYMGIDIMWLLKSKNRLKRKPCWFQFIGKDIYYQDIYKTDSSTWWTWLIEGVGKLRTKNKRIR